MSYANDTKYFEERNKLKRKCKHCGHTQAIPLWIEKQECDWCKNYIFTNEEKEKKYRFRENLYREMRRIK